MNEKKDETMMEIDEEQEKIINPKEKDFLSSESEENEEQKKEKYYSKMDSSLAITTEKGIISFIESASVAEACLLVELLDREKPACYLIRFLPQPCADKFKWQSFNKNTLLNKLMLKGVTISSYLLPTEKIKEALQSANIKISQSSIYTNELSLKFNKEKETNKAKIFLIQNAAISPQGKLISELSSIGGWRRFTVTCATSSDNEIAMHIPDIERNTDKEKSILDAARRGQADRLKRGLEKISLSELNNIRYKESDFPGKQSYTPLMFAVEAGNFEMVKNLVEKGADIYACTEFAYKDNKTASDIAENMAKDDKNIKMQKIYRYLKEREEISKEKKYKTCTKGFGEKLFSFLHWRQNPSVEKKQLLESVTVSLPRESKESTCNDRFASTKKAL